MKTFEEENQRLKKAGIIRKPDDDCPPFVREGERFRDHVFHDVMYALYFSRFIYLLGDIRDKTRQLGFGDGAKEREILINEVLNINLYNDSEDMGKSTAKLIRGKLKLEDEDGDGYVDPPPINMKQIEHVLKDERYREVSEYYATELDIMLLHSFSEESADVQLYKFDAVNDKRALVYAISSRKKDNYYDLFLTFRGSSTVQDWLQNFQAPFVAINLRCDNSGKYFLVEQYSYKTIQIEGDLFKKISAAIGDTPIHVHRGFLAYLFDTKHADKNKKDDKIEVNGQATRQSFASGRTTFRNIGVSKYQSIKNDLDLLFKGGGDGKQATSLYITGHSLGAALATLTAFLLACDIEVRVKDSGTAESRKFQGFTCISFASPMVGNIGFQRAFHALQNYKKEKPSDENGLNVSEYEDDQSVRLRHIRFINDRDLVPLSPPLSRYRHTACTRVHLNHFSPWFPVWNSISLEHPHRSKMDKKCKNKDDDLPLGLLPPTSSLSGLFATSFPFLWTTSMTAPAVLAVIYILVCSLLRNLPARSIFSEFFEALPISVTKPIQDKFDEFWADHPSLQTNVMVIFWILWVVCAIRPNADWKRTLFIAITFPVLLCTNIRIVNEELYQYVTRYSEAIFVVGAIAWHVVLLLLRKSYQVTNATTHSLTSYYDSIRYDHERLSSSAAIIEKVSGSYTPPFVPPEFQPLLDADQR